MSWHRILSLLIAALIISGSLAAKSRYKVITSADGARMVRIPEGAFIMGDDNGEPDERPVREVTLSAFRIDINEVTYGRYEGCISAGICRAPKNFKKVEDKVRAVVGVSWEDAVDFCGWAKKRLPTEAEWEKAARGVKGRKYPWGDGIDCTRANYRECGIGRAIQVGSYPKSVSPYGINDMAGNAWEWVADYYDPKYYKTAPATDPKGPQKGKYRVVRGGSWARPMIGMRSADRAGFKPGTRAEDIGFRCVLND